MQFKKDTVIHYGLLVLVRVSVLTLLLLVVCNWVVQINAAMSLQFFDQAQVSFIEPESVSNQITTAVNNLSGTILTWSIVSLILVGVFSMTKRAQKYEKKTIILNQITIIFLLISTAFSQSIIRAFIAGL